MTASITAFPRAAQAPRPTTGLKPERVARLIREMIIQDELSAGAPIRERTLAEKLNVSRTPLREALKILAGEGLVELQPRRGAIVSAPDDREVRELLELLGALEGFAAGLAGELATAEDIAEIRALHYEMLAAYTRGDRLGYFHRNQDIHRAIVQASRNNVLIEHHRQVNARVYRARYVCNLRTERWEKAIREHEAMLEALERHDGARLREILEKHVLRAWDLMMELRAKDEQAAAAPA